jgi:hypothetical protein
MDFLKTNIIDLLNKADRNELVLPNFQRNYVWKTEQQKMLIASFLVNLPIGTFLTLEGEKDDFISKKLCFKSEADPNENCLYLLDGQQRLSTIKSIFSELLNFNDWESKFDELHSPLRNKWFLDLNEENCQECLGFSYLNFNVNVSSGKKGSINYVPILSTKEPSDIIDAIKYSQIFKTKKDNKFHPGRKFKITSTSEFDKKLELAYLFANDNHIPLFDFLSNDKTIIKNTLKIIGSAKVESLKYDCQNDSANDYELSNSFLNHLDSNIQSKYKNGKWDEINAIWEQLKDNWVEDIMEYFKDLFKAELMVPNIKSNELSRATSVFEYMNKGGTPLDTFDIMVAKYAEVGSDETLYDKLESIVSELIYIPRELSKKDALIGYSAKEFGVFSNEVLTKSIKELFLNFLSLCYVNDIDKIDLTHIKKDKILALKKNEIDSVIDEASKALIRSLAFLQFRCGIHNINFFSYNLMIIPLGLILKDDIVWNDKFKLDKLEFWYWTSLFSGRFREKQNQRAISETKEIYSWIIKNIPNKDVLLRKENVFTESNYSDESTLLLKNEDKSVPTAIYNGILQYVLSKGPNDFTEDVSKLNTWEITMNGISIQDHHIIPLGSTTTLGESTKILRSAKQNILNSPLNRTFITQKANQNISSMSVERYLPLLNKAIEYSQCMPDGLISKVTSDETFQETFVKNRFYKIKNTLLNELTELEG